MDEPAARRLSATLSRLRGRVAPVCLPARPPARPQVVIVSLADLLASNDKSR